MRAYAIGDIHGQFELLQAAQALVAADRARVGDAHAPLVHVGDLVDRGPASAKVIAHLRTGQEAGQPWVVLKGNHDLLMQQFLADPLAHHPMLSEGMTWFSKPVGGMATVASYGIELAAEPESAADLKAARTALLAKMPQADRDWLTTLPTHYLHGDQLFVHAGIRPGLDLRQQTENDMLWIRRAFLDDPRDHGVLVVHGHTAIKQVTHFGNRLGIDTNAARGGPVSAVVIEGRQAWLLTPEGRQPL